MMSLQLTHWQLVSPVFTALNKQVGSSQLSEQLFLFQAELFVFCLQKYCTFLYFEAEVPINSGNIKERKTTILPGVDEPEVWPVGHKFSILYFFTQLS